MGEIKIINYTFIIGNVDIFYLCTLHTSIDTGVYGDICVETDIKLYTPCYSKGEWAQIEEVGLD